MKNSDLELSEKEIKLEDILSLDIPQIMILFFLSTKYTETVRYTLLQDVNKLFFPDAKISASSFYNTLDKLERLGLLEIKKNKTGRVRSVRGKPKIRAVLDIIGQYTTILNFDMDSMYKDFIGVFEKFTKINQVQSLLLIDIEEFFDFGITQFLKKYGQELFLLADDESFVRYSNRGLKQVHQSQVINARIREPDKIFDLVFILDFHQKNDFYGMNDKTILKEAIRVTKSQGIVVISGTDDFPSINYSFLEGTVNKLKQNPIFNIIKYDVFKDLITSVSPVEPEFINHKGHLLGKIKIP